MNAPSVHNNLNYCILLKCIMHQYMAHVQVCVCVCAGVCVCVCLSVCVCVCVCGYTCVIANNVMLHIPPHI